MTMSHSERQVRRKAMAELVRSGSSMDSVAQLHKTHIRSVYLACKENGVICTTTRKVAVKSFAVLALLFNPNLSYRQIGEQLGMHFQLVYKIHKQAIEAGIPGLPKRVPGRTINRGAKP